MQIGLGDVAASLPSTSSVLGRSRLDCSGKMTFLEPSREDDGEKLRVCFTSGIISSGEVSKALVKFLHVFI